MSKGAVLLLLGLSFLSAVGCVRQYEQVAGHGLHSENNLETREEESRSEAEAGLTLSQELEIADVAAVVQGKSEIVTRVLKLESVSSFLKKLGEDALAESKAAMVKRFSAQPVNYVGPVGETSGADVVSVVKLQIELMAIGETNEKYGTLIIEELKNGEAKITLTKSPDDANVAFDGGGTYASPISLNVFALSLADQAFHLGQALSTHVAKDLLADLQKEKPSAKILIQSFVTAQPGSQCRNTAHPCRDSYLKLKESLPGRSSSDLGTLFVRNYARDTDPDSAHLWAPGVLFTQGEISGFNLSYESPIALNMLRYNILKPSVSLSRIPEVIKRGLNASEFESKAKELSEAASARGEAFMVTRVKIEERDSVCEAEKCDDVVLHLGTYKPGQEGTPDAGLLIVRVFENSEKPVKVEFSQKP